MRYKTHEIVGSNDLTRYVDALVDEFNLGGIEEKYSTQGRPGYHPRIIVKLLVYGRIRGITSSRELAQAAAEYVQFMYLAQNERPELEKLGNSRTDFSLKERNEVNRELKSFP